METWHGASVSAETTCLPRRYHQQRATSAARTLRAKFDPFIWQDIYQQAITVASKSALLRFARSPTGTRSLPERGYAVS